MTGGIWKWLAAALISVWTAVAGVVHLLLAMMVIDFVTGTMCAIRRGDLEGHLSWRGLMKKSSVLIVVLTVYLLQHALLNVEGVKIAVDLGQTVALAYCWNETVSILENCACMGAPIPNALLKMLQKVPDVKP